MRGVNQDIQGLISVLSRDETRPRDQKMTDFTTKQDLAPPLVKVLMDDDSRWDESGLLPAGLLSLPLSVEVPAWDHTPTPWVEIYLEAFWDDVRIYAQTWSGDIPSIPAHELIFEVSVDKLTHGVHTLHYTVSNSDGNTNTSLSQEVTVDMVPPLLGVNRGQLQFDTVDVTEQYLSEHDHKLIGAMPAYVGGKAGDVVTWYWNENPNTVFDSDVVTSMILQREEAGQPMDLVFDGDMILARKDGKRYAFYALSDRAGNLSPYSQAVELLVAAQPVPRVLPPPKVVEASGSSSASTLNPANATGGVTVRVPDDAVIRPGETLCVQWAEPDSVGAYRTEKSELRVVRVPSTRIAQHFGKSIPVYYDVFESGVDTPHSSARHTLSVLHVDGFPTVQCDKVSGGTLKLGDIASGGKASFTLQKWFLMWTDQFINIEVRGSDDEDQPVVIQVLKEYQVPQVAQTIDVGHITKVDLQRFKIGREIEVRVHVSFDEKLSWRQFPSLKPKLEV
ncbi:DUF5011 domain-containing protein [Pseudomonas alliivorans]|uniref:DUF5011 domain-containing protein n=1 Tax=Pseudomonas alliivorans TaxID=2810613 RepID=UPI00211BFC31|nr:DUF5011 domain-containing protein [Pseudomonas alliivorans]MCQ9470064.1 DUF5011 domain-containing protein [Pseudomonas alliivorans]